MSALELYIKAAQNTKGTDHMWAINSLRRYMNVTNIEELIRYINTLTDIDQLRILIEAGLRGDSHRAAVSRIAQLQQQQAQR